MAAYTIYVTRKIRNGALRQLESIGTVTGWDEERPVPREELLARIRTADALLCLGDDRIDRAVIEAGQRLRVISTASAGYDHIDTEAASERNIIVCHAPGIGDDAVADMTIALLLACARSVIDANHFIRERAWRYWSPYLFEGIDVRGSTIGIVGLGHIGLEVAHRALGFGMRVLYYNSRRDEDAEQSMGLQYGSLDNLLREADFVTLHVPLTRDTYGLLDERRLRLMKPTAYLINMARGAVVDHDALVRALREGWIAGAGLDVFNKEPLPADDPLLELPNVVLSPHIGANTRHTMTSLLRTAADQIAQVLHGQQPSHPVPIIFTGRRAA